MIDLHSEMLKIQVNEDLHSEMLKIQVNDRFTQWNAENSSKW